MIGEHEILHIDANTTILPIGGERIARVDQAMELAAQFPPDYEERLKLLVSASVFWRGSSLIVMVIKKPADSAA